VGRLRVLVVDDNKSAADALAAMLRRGGDDVEAVYDGAVAIETLVARRPDVVLTDLRMEPIDGMDVLRAARAQEPPIEVIVFTAFGEIETAVEAMRLGARDFLTKPVGIPQIEARLAPLRPTEAAAPAPATRDAAAGFVAVAPSSRNLLDLLTRVADVPTPVWLEGDVGTGRGHAARLLHELGRPETPLTLRDPRQPEPWPSEGTVVLPGVDDLPDAAQVRLYQALARVPPKVRLVSLSATRAAERVAEGRLRPELYYDLAVIVIQVPPLRERVEDIEPLLHHALDLFAARYGRERPTPTPAQLARLREHSWPGNVRELMNLAERAVVIDATSLDQPIRQAPPQGLPALGPGFSLATYLESIERSLLVEALRLADGDRAVAGRLLGVERNTLRYKLNKYDLLD
jgi:two-component system response regulator HydG